MANTPKETNDRSSTKGQKQAKKAAFRNKAEADKSEAKWFNPEPREEASTALPETPANARIQEDRNRPGALAAGGGSDTGDKSRNFETSRHASQPDTAQPLNRGLSADSGLTQNRRAESSGVTHLGSAPYQGTGEQKLKGAGEEALPADFSREREHQRDASLQTGATSRMTPAENLGTREAGHPGRRLSGQPATETPNPPRSADSPEDMRDRQTRTAGADPRGMEKQGKNEGPNAKQTLKRGAGDDTPRH